jgi:hypothetical protein
MHMKTTPRLLSLFAFLVLAAFALSVRADIVQLRIEAPKTSITVGETLQLRVVAVSDTGVETDITAHQFTTYARTPPDRATVSATGLVTGKAAGDVFVIVGNDEVDPQGNTSRTEFQLQVRNADDLDNDGMPDAWETQHGLDPNAAADATLDPDQDGLTNLDEYTHGTNPQNADTDGDGRDDGMEVEHGLEPAHAETLTPDQPLDDHCVVSILNRVARVRPDGTWILTNIPATGQQVRARATCQRPSGTTFGQSDFVVVPAFGAIENVQIFFTNPVPVPGKLTLSAPRTSLSTIGSTLSLTATITYGDNSTANATSNAGTNYISSNTDIATVSAAGVVTAVGPGGVNVSATNEGTLAVMHLIVTGSPDADGDGMPDSFETANGFNPNDPSDAAGDADNDGVTNVDEFNAGTDPHKTDSDGDGIADGVEIQNGTNPVDPASFDLHRALRSLSISPSSFVLMRTPIRPYITKQLQVIGTMLDGRTLDLSAASRGTTYNSTNLGVVQFATSDGLISAGDAGFSTITATSNGFTATATIEVRAITDPAIAQLALPDYANNVKVAGNYAYIADQAGLIVVDIADKHAPYIVSTTSVGNVVDLRVSGNYVYAVGSTFMVFDVSNPAAPSQIGSLSTAGGSDIAIDDRGIAYVAADPGGLRIVSIADPHNPVLLATVNLTGARGVSLSGTTAVVATQQSDSLVVAVIDVRVPAQPAILGSIAFPLNNSFSRAEDVVADGTRAYFACYGDGLRIIDFSNPAAPTLVATMTGFVPHDVALGGGYAFFADERYINSIPVVDLRDPANPFYIANLDLEKYGDINGTGIDVDSRYAYLTGGTSFMIAQHTDAVDTAGIAPVVHITPAAGTPLVDGETAAVRITVDDDVAVADVVTKINGSVSTILSHPPYASTIVVPAAGGTVTFDVTATDFGGNTTHVSESHAIVPDPGTTVTGVVKMAEGLPAIGAVVTALGVSGIADANGAYSIPGVPTTKGDFIVTVELQDGERKVKGQSATAVTPVRGGTTSVPVINLQVGLKVTLTSTTPAGTTLTEWQQISVTVNAGEDDPEGTLALIYLFVQGHQVADIRTHELPFTTSVSIPSGSGQAEVTATAEDTLHNRAHATLTYGVIADAGATLTGVVKRGDGTPVAGALVTLIEQAAEPTGYFVWSDGWYDAPFINVHATTDANGAYTLTGVNTLRGNVVVHATLLASGEVTASGASSPQSVTRGQTTTVPDIIAAAPSPQVGKMSFYDWPQWVDLNGRRAAVAVGGAAYFIDIQNPADPRILGYVTSGDPYTWVQTVKLAGNYAYVTLDEGRLIVYDISDPAHPVERSSVNDLPLYATGVDAASHYIYVVSGDLFIIDVANPAAPVVVKQVTGPHHMNQVRISGTLALVTYSSTSSLAVIDISDPANAAIIGQVTLPSGNSGLVVRGNYAYIGGSASLMVVDFSDPHAPVVLPSIPVTSLSPYGVAIASDRLCTSGNPPTLSQSLLLYDFGSTPGAPVAAAPILLPDANNFNPAWFEGSGSYLALLGWPDRDAPYSPTAGQLLIIRVPEAGQP